MSIAIIYWSGTGNTEAMAQAVEEGAKARGGDRHAALCRVRRHRFRLPRHGTEVLEEGKFEPMFTVCLPELSGKTIALFGSYGWGDGEWMRQWEETCSGAGAKLA